MWPVGSTTICEREWQGRAPIYVRGVGQRHSQSSALRLKLHPCNAGVTLSQCGARFLIRKPNFVTHGDYLAPDSSALCFVFMAGFIPAQCNTHGSLLHGRSDVTLTDVTDVDVVTTRCRRSVNASDVTDVNATTTLCLRRIGAARLGRNRSLYKGQLAPVFHSQ